MSYVLDLDKFKPDPLEVTIDGKKYVIPIIPSEFAFETYEFLPLIEKLEKTQRIEKEDYNKIVDMYARILKLADDSIDFEWLNKRVNFAIFNAITPIFFQAIFAGSKKNEAEKEDA